MRLRRLRSGTLAAVRLRRRPGLPGTPPVPEPTVGPSIPSGVSSVNPRGRLARALRDDPPDARILENPHRPLPGANAWPDDAVLLTYAEVRALVALHLDTAASTLRRDKPWEHLRQIAGAVRDGEAPLRLSEVMTP